MGIQSPLPSNGRKKLIMYSFEDVENRGLEISALVDLATSSKRVDWENTYLVTAISHCIKFCIDEIEEGLPLVKEDLDEDSSKGSVFDCITRIEAVLLGLSCLHDLFFGLIDPQRFKLATFAAGTFGRELKIIADEAMRSSDDSSAKGPSTEAETIGQA